MDLVSWNSINSVSYASLTAQKLTWGERLERKQIQMVSVLSNKQIPNIKNRYATKSNPRNRGTTISTHITRLVFDFNTHPWVAPVFPGFWWRQCGDHQWRSIVITKGQQQGQVPGFRRWFRCFFPIGRWFGFGGSIRVFVGPWPTWVSGSIRD